MITVLGVLVSIWWGFQAHKPMARESGDLVICMQKTLLLLPQAFHLKLLWSSDFLSL
jgi:hypothetical protein